MKILVRVKTGISCTLNLRNFNLVPQNQRPKLGPRPSAKG